MPLEYQTERNNLEILKLGRPAIDHWKCFKNIPENGYRTYLLRE